MFLHKPTCILTVVHKEDHKTRGQSCVAEGFQKHCSSSELNMCFPELNMCFASRSSFKLILGHKSIEITLVDDTV